MRLRAEIDMVENSFLGPWARTPGRRPGRWPCWLAVRWQEPTRFLIGRFYCHYTLHTPGCVEYAHRARGANCAHLGCVYCGEVPPETTYSCLCHTILPRSTPCKPASLDSMQTKSSPEKKGAP